jgi:uncharacterized protein
MCGVLWHGQTRLKKARSTVMTMEEELASCAARHGRTSELVALLDKAPQLANARSQGRWTPLIWAGLEGHLDTCRLLLQHGARVNDTDTPGRSALYWACYRDQAAVVGMLLARGADPTLTDHFGYTALMTASSYGCEATVRSLLRHEGARATIDWPDREDGRTAVTKAAAGGHAGVLCLLLGAGADDSIADLHGVTAVQAARANGKDDCVRLLEVRFCSARTLLPHNTPKPLSVCGALI